MGKVFSELKHVYSTKIALLRLLRILWVFENLHIHFENIFKKWWEKMETPPFKAKHYQQKVAQQTYICDHQNRGMAKKLNKMFSVPPFYVES